MSSAPNFLAEIGLGTPRFRVGNEVQVFWHVWFPTKYRRSTLVGDVARVAKAMFWECGQRHGYKILEVGTNKDHAHVLVWAQDRKELSAIVRTIKAVSAASLLKQLRERNQESKARAFWARRYLWKQVDESSVVYVQQYIREQDTEGT